MRPKDSLVSALVNGALVVLPVYTANGPSNDVSVIATGSKSVVAKIPVGTGP